jgi:hypothetical protein
MSQENAPQKLQHGEEKFTIFRMTGSQSVLAAALPSAGAALRQSADRRIDARCEVCPP